jgi:YidC/Oxa1 family membrane protein insertase
MSEKRNLVIFVLASIVLLFGYSFIMNKYSSKPALFPIEQKPVEEQPQQEASARVPAPTKPAHELPAAAKLSIAQPEVFQPESTPVDLNARFMASNEYLELTWRQHDGAIVQAVWKEDGTPFFPKETIEADGKHNPPEFIGVGGAMDSKFSGPPQVLEAEGGKTIVFSNAAGDRLEYFLPNNGYALGASWHSPAKSNLFLLRALNDIPTMATPGTGAPYEANPFKGLENGRVFSIEGNKIHSVVWNKILTDPWFKFVGRKRKTLPPSAQRLGLDAGVEPSRRQSTHYFVAIWDSEHLPIRDAAWRPGFYLAPDSGGNAAARLYLGPKQTESLASFHPVGQPELGKPFQQVMDFGFFGLIAKFLFFVLRFIQKFIPNWGWALVVFGVLVRLSLWVLNTKTTVGMLRQKDLEPYQKQIQAKYEKFNDMAKKVEMQKELRAFWKKNGHNPMGSCLPMLVQMPVFMALWSMLQNVYELRHAPWIFWIKDLSDSDPIFILPALMVGTMIAQQAMMPAIGDPQQRKMMMVIMPVMMGFLFAYLPAGLTLYYLLFNIVGMGQTWWLMRNYKPQPVVI